MPVLGMKSKIHTSRRKKNTCRVEPIHGPVKTFINDMENEKPSLLMCAKVLPVQTGS